LNAGGTSFNAAFDSTGQRMVGGGGRGAVRVLDIPTVPTPVPPWFLELAEAVAGTRLGARGNVELVSRRELEEVAQRLAQTSGGSFYERLGRWFLADPAQRATSPF
jgi:hypothetical protein